jgi:hypothetical protein
MQRFPSVIVVAIHVAAGVGLVWLIDAGVGGTRLSMAFDALVYADASLVGMWAGLGRHSKAAGFFGVGGTVAAMAALVLGSLWHSISGLVGPGNDVWVTVWLLMFQLALAMLSDDLAADLRRLQSEFQYELVATVLDDDARPLERIERAQRTALLFGSEGHGLARSLVDLCDRKVTIPMRPGTDSLNVAVAAGIILHHYLRVAERGCTID